MKSTQTAPKHKSAAFTDEEKSAMKARVKELKQESSRAEDESAFHAAIAGLQAPDRTLGQRLHAVIKAAVPGLSPKPWYGMPAYYKDGKLICHFQPAQKFKTRYASLGFSDAAKLDEGDLWPVAYALPKLTPATEKTIAALVRKAAG